MSVLLHGIDDREQPRVDATGVPPYLDQGARSACGAYPTPPPSMLWSPYVHLLSHHFLGHY